MHRLRGDVALAGLGDSPSPSRAGNGRRRAGFHGANLSKLRPPPELLSLGGSHPQDCLRKGPLTPDQSSTRT